jgi:DNA polymerase-3 subunit epsilon
MRQIILDSETTGLEPEQGHRIIEIGALEMKDRRLTGREFHAYLNPERDIDDGALEVHGLTAEFLRDKPRFAEIVDDLLGFLQGSELIIHNAPFDLGFLDYELGLLGREGLIASTAVQVLDTLEMARELHPGQRNNLDALCKRYEVDNSSRTLHGALLDAGILADVYLAMTGGQADLGLSLEGLASAGASGQQSLAAAGVVSLKVLRANDEELSLHRKRLAAIAKESGECLWVELGEEMA